MAKYKLDPRIEKLETAYDSANLDEGKLRKAWPRGYDLVEAFAKRRWDEVYTRAEELVLESAEPAEQAFALQWAMAAAEAGFDLDRRARYLNMWEEVADWSDDPYCRYLRAYHLGLTHFYGGALAEAQACFQLGYAVCDAMSYPRGVVRMIFHLGLVAREQGQVTVAVEHFQHARMLAAERNAVSWVNRIAKELEILATPPGGRKPTLLRAPRERRGKSRVTKRQRSA